MNEKIKLCSLFSGCGGFDYGFNLSDFEIVFAIDSYSWACETYKTNLGLPIIQKRIQDVNIDEIPECDVVIGGFPCQGFSTAGWFKKDDSRNELYIEMLDIIEKKQPSLFLAENVMGLLYMEDGKVLEYIMKDFSNIGYKVKYKAINCADYGVPQQRKRIFIMGVKDGYSIKFPQPTHHKNPKSTLFPEKYKKWRTVRQAIGDLENSNEPYAKGKINNVQSKYKIRPDEPSRYTILASAPKIPIHYNGSRNDEYPRRLTVRECARLQSFPESFKFSGPLTAQFKQIGNAVPPLVSCQFAKTIRDIIYDKNN
ncbi:MAG: DNA cytosine methyltransferase [Candidatus Lokiarchaeota archaeon]|nr:DNA cytosine methyltransferase [Candidatus Lokiarchaeota archaeon]